MNDTTKICFVDIETTSLDPNTGQVWEVGLIVRDANYPGRTGDTEYLWQLPVCLENADPMSLKIGKFRERRYRRADDHDLFDSQVRDLMIGGSHAAEMYDGPKEGLITPCVVHHDWMPFWTEEFAKLTHESHLVGNVVSFDEERLRKLLRGCHEAETWHYHLVDVEALIAGRLGIKPPWRSKDLSKAINVDVPEDQHSALADARWARDMYDAVFDSADEHSPTARLGRETYYEANPDQRV